MATNQEVLEGKLVRSGTSTGAQATGWAILPHNEQGGLAIEVDVRPVQATATKLVGMQVRAWGVYSAANSAEQGKAPVFLVQRLEAVS